MIFDEPKGQHDVITYLLRPPGLGEGGAVAFLMDVLCPGPNQLDHLIHLALPWTHYSSVDYAALSKALLSPNPNQDLFR